MKKLLYVMTALLILMTVSGAQADAAVWDFDTDSFKLNGYQGEGGAVVIPDIMEEVCTVDILGMYLFNDADTVTSLTLPSTLKQIEDSAVAFCDSLTELIIPEGVQIIGDNCFIGNPKLTEAVIPASVRYIGTSSFGNNESLSKVTFLGECPVFAGAALDWIADDAQIYVPDDQYDAYVAALTKAECSASVVSSGANAVVYDRTTDPSLFDFDSATGTITLFKGYDVCVQVPAEIGGVPVKAIGENAFNSHPYLCYLTLPEGLESIGASAFEWCKNLVHVDFPTSLKTIASRAFYAGYKGYGLELPAVETIGSEAFAWCVRISDPIYLPEGLKTIESSAFDGCGWLSEVYLPASLEAIGERAFADSSLNYLVFESLGLPQIADNAFENCSYLADIDLHTKSSKQDMLSLQAKVDALNLSCRVWRMQNPDVDYINDGLDIYENGVLVAYTGQQTHVRPWDNDYNEITVTAIGDGAFKDNQTIEYFAVPYNDRFTTIGAEAFANSSLATIDLFDSVTTINGGAFRNCVNLTELTLPESVTFMGVESLYGCSNLQKLTVLCDPTVLPEDLFDVWPENLEIYAGKDATDDQLKYLSKIAGRPFHKPVTRIGEPLPRLIASPYEALPAEDFWYDTEFARLDSYQGYELNLVLPGTADGTPLRMIGGSMMERACYGDNFEQELPVVSVVIPENYADIPAYAFQNCETLETIICYAPLEMLNDSMFKNCTALREVVFVNGVGGIGAYVFDGCTSLETVYVGPHADSVSEYAFMDEYGQSVWSLDKCITDPALMPDVDALLTAVKREPMAAPEPAAPVVAVPVGAEGAPFVGLWHGTEIVMGSETYTFADFDMIMTLMLCEDGRMIIADSESIDMSLVGDGDWMAWRVENGAAMGDHSVMTLMDDGRLCVDEDGALMIFVREGDAPAASAQIMTEVRYVCVSADMSGFTMDASALGGEYAVTLHEDGSADFVVVGSPMPTLTWKQTADGFALDYFGTPLAATLTDAGFDLNYFDTMLLHFVPQK